jgi:hypothetical protein
MQSREAKTPQSGAGPDVVAESGPIGTFAPPSSATTERLIANTSGTLPPALVEELGSAGGNGAVARLVQDPAGGGNPAGAGSGDLGPEADALFDTIATMHANSGETETEPAGAAPEPMATSQKTGTAAFNRTRAYLDQDARLKEQTDRLRVALREIRAEKSVPFNQNAGKGILNTIGSVLGLNAARVKELQDRWDGLVLNRRAAAGGGAVAQRYASEQAALFGAMQSRLEEARKAHPRAQTHDRMRYLSAAIADIIYSASDPTMSPDAVFTIAYNEGLDKYVRDEIGLPQGAVPTVAQLDSVSTTKPVDGFAYLGLDDFRTDLDAGQVPLRNLLPPGYDLSKLVPIDRRNEFGTIKHSAIFPDLRAALQGLVAMVKRRRQLFVTDADRLGYTERGSDEVMFWTYLYFNPGEYAGRAQLTKYRGRRKLADWIAAGEYPESQKVLASYRMVREMKLF